MKYFITATGTDIGKTYVANLLCKQNNWQAFKPVECGSNDSEILNCTPLYKLKAPMSPHLAAREEGVVIDFDKIIHACKTSTANIIEGAGGIMSPLSESKTNLDLAKALNVPTILVVGNYLGTISHTLTALKCLEGIKVEVIINEIDSSQNNSLELAETIKNFSGIKPKILQKNAIKI